MIFQDRNQVGRLLSRALQAYEYQNPLVMGIPRGGVPIAAQIAQAIHGDLDVILVHKIPAPGQPELAIGAIDESGNISVNPIAEQMGADKTYVEAEAARQLDTIKTRRKQYTPARAPLSPRGRSVIVVDDGIATGATMSAAIKALRSQHPEKIIVAVAVAPPSTVDRLKTEADEVICLEQPINFYAVGQFFEDFSPVTDQDVMNLLNPSHTR